MIKKVGAILLLLLSGGRLLAAPSIPAYFAGSSSVSVTAAWTLTDPGTQSAWFALSADPSFATFISSSALPLGQQTTTYYGLQSNATYYFTVKVDSYDDSAYSVPVATATPPDFPRSPALGSVCETAVSFSWMSGSNAAGTVYSAEASVDDAFAFPSVQNAASLSASFSALNPNTTYYLRVRAIGHGGQDSPFAEIGSTVTLAYPPASEAYGVVSSTGLSLFWFDNGNPSGTRYDLVVSTAEGFATVNYSSVTSGNYYDASGLRPDTTYYFKAAAVNGGGTLSSYTVFVPTHTYAAVPGANASMLGSPTANSVQAQWLDNGNPAWTEYYVQASTASDLSGTDYGTHLWSTGPSYTVNTLEPQTLYYFRARARDALGRTSGWLNLGSMATAAGPDVNPPSVTDLQGGDDTWRGSSSGSYMVHFSDLGSGLSKFQVRAATGPAYSGVLLADWTDAVTGIDAPEYSSDWTLPDAVFSAIPEGVTAYISVKVYDQAATPNYTEYKDAFYVRRDTTPPVITDNAASPAGWLSADPGAVCQTPVTDALSGPAALYYSASVHEGTADAGVINWTAVAGFTPGQPFSASWGVAFGSLTNGASNYISLRAADAAGNVRELADVFRILKNDAGPAVSITAPAAGYVSTATAVSGSASAMNEQSPVAKVQVSIQRVSDTKYYDGTDFTSDTAVWLAAAGLSSWSYNASTVPFSAALSYKVYARAADPLGNFTQTPYPFSLFQFDQTLPEVYISTPLPDSLVYSFDSAEGSASDAGGAGLRSVDVYVKRVSDGRWWNFLAAAWGDSPVGSAATGSAAWSFVPSDALRGALAHGQRYFVTPSAYDAASPANASPFAAAGSTFTWTDTVPPSDVTDFRPSTGTLPGRVNLLWTFPGDDGSLALTYGEFAVQYSTFQTASFSTQAAQVLISTAMVPAGSEQRYTISGLTPGTSYYFRVWSKDDADHWSGPSPLVMTMSGERLDEMITGTVRTPSGTGVAGVSVEAIGSDGLPVSYSYTVDDGSGSFTLDNLPDGFYRVQASWVQEGFSSSVAKDLIPMGYCDADFVLSVDYLLASVSGTLPLSVPAPSGRVQPASPGYSARLLRGGRLVASAAPDRDGRFTIRNLMPGSYSLKLVSQAGTRSLPIELAAGQALELHALGALLDKADVYVYPNPASSYAVFHAGTSVSPVRKQLSVFGLDGSLVKSAGDGDPGWTSVSGGWEYRWDFGPGSPASGVYFYTVRLKDALGGESRGVTRKLAVIR